MKFKIYHVILVLVVIFILYRIKEHFYPTSAGTLTQLMTSRPMIGMRNHMVPMGRM